MSVSPVDRTITKRYKVLAHTHRIETGQHFVPNMSSVCNVPTAADWAAYDAAMASYMDGSYWSDGLPSARRTTPFTPGASWGPAATCTTAQYTALAAAWAQHLKQSAAATKQPLHTLTIFRILIHVCDDHSRWKDAMAAPMYGIDAELVISDDPRAIDFQQLRALQQETSWARDRSPLDLRRAVAASDLVLTAWRGPTLVGCVRVLSDFVYRAVLCDVIVHPDYQGIGIGRVLVEGVTGHPRLAQVRKFTLLTTTARRFYERLGWRRYPGEGMIYERERPVTDEGDEQW